MWDFSAELTKMARQKTQARTEGEPERVYTFRPMERKDVKQVYNVIKDAFDWYGDRASFLRELSGAVAQSEQRARETTPTLQGREREVLESILTECDVGPMIANKARKAVPFEYYVLSGPRNNPDDVIGVIGIEGDNYGTPNVAKIGWTAAPKREDMKRMIREVIKLVKSRGVDTLVVEQDSKLVEQNKLYKSMGFKERGRMRGYFEHEEDHVTYAKDLSKVDLRRRKYRDLTRQK